MVSMQRTSRTIPGLLATTALSSILLLVAGCGGSSTPGVAHLSAGKGSADPSSESSGSAPESKASAQTKLVAYAKCMRANGVPDFPEPDEGGIQLKSHNGSGPNPESAQFQAAERQCHKLMPEGGKPSPQMQKQMQERALKFSSCVRAHGEPNFPEPEFQGNAVRMRLKAGSGLDPRSPQFRAAQNACQQYFGPPGSKGGPGAGAPPGGGASTQSGGGGGGEKGGNVLVAP